MKIDRNKIWLMFNKKCAYCGCELLTPTGKHMHIDHVKSISRNWWTTGCLFPENDTEENLFPTCPFCNRYKSSLSLESFRKWLIDTPRKLEKVTLYRNARRFGMIDEKKWDGIFWFEKIALDELCKIQLNTMKQIDYMVFPSEEKTIQVEDDPIYGGAHEYSLKNSIGFNNGVAEYVNSSTTIQFVQKNDDGTMIPGVQSEQLAFVLMDRAVKLNNRFPSSHNEKMIAGLKMFIEACEERVKERISRGVMGELKK